MTDSITPTFSGEMQLAGWSESHTGGCKVTFWLPSPDDLQAFRTLTVRKGNTAGQRFMAALVEIGDDELPVKPDAGIPASQKPKGGPLAKLAGRWSNDPVFLEWINSTTHAGIFWHARTPDDAADFIRERCEVSSRADLDHNKYAESLFHELIRGPFQKYMIAKGITQ